MKISIFNLLSETAEQQIQAMTAYYKDQYPEAAVTVIPVDAGTIKDCIGCWSCWVRTPGLCVHQDAMTQIYEQLMASDRVVLAMPTGGGFLSGAAKTFIDRLIPLYHPYIMIHHGEMMHYARYDSYPEMDFYWDRTSLTEEADAVVEDYFYRVAYHFRKASYRIHVSDHQVRSQLLAPRDPKADLPWQKLQSADRTGKIVIYNGSPRGKKGNSLRIVNQLVQGFKAQGIAEEDILIRHLIDQKQHDAWAADFHQHARHMFVFPLYVHAMPGIVMKFFEKLAPSADGKTQLSFFVQSGFSEGFQSHYLRAFLCRLPKRLNCQYGGILIKGGMEGLQMQPDEANKKLYAKLQDLGAEYVAAGGMPEAEVAALASKVHLSSAVKFFFKVFKPTGLIHFYWNMQLKKNGAFEKRFDKPYACNR